MPAEGLAAGEFVFNSAPFLTAMQNGHWILLDEMNLALNKCWKASTLALIFAGKSIFPNCVARFSNTPSSASLQLKTQCRRAAPGKGLPKSFLDRFTRVWLDPLARADLISISTSAFPEMASAELSTAVDFSVALSKQLGSAFGQEGAPWDINLRDLLRWIGYCHSPTGLEIHQQLLEEYSLNVYIQRFRTQADRQAVANLLARTLTCEPMLPNHLDFSTKRSRSLWVMLSSQDLNTCPVCSSNLSFGIFSSLYRRWSIACSTSNLPFLLDPERAARHSSLTVWLPRQGDD